MALRPLHNAFLFQFLNETTSGQFLNKNKGRIIIATPELDTQGTLARWVRVVAVGDRVKDFKVGDVVLVAPGKWTIGFKHEDQKFWKSDDEWVLAIGDESLAYEYDYTSA